MSEFRRRMMMAQVYNHNTGYVQDGLICHLDGINSAFNSQSEPLAIWEDLSGNDNHCTFSNVIHNSDNIEFNGASSSGTLDNFLSSATTTVEVAFKIANGNKGIVIFGDSASNEICLYANTVSGLMIFNSTPPGVLTTRPTVIDACSYLQKSTASITYNSALQSYYRNGSQVALNHAPDYLASSVYSYNRIYLGARHNYNDNTRYFFNGKIYAVRIYDRVLSAAEIACNASVDSQRFNFSEV